MNTNYKVIKIDEICESPTNPRHSFDEADLAKLAQSIRVQGVIQPILVRPSDGDFPFEIVCGARRYRASLIAEQSDIPCMVRDLDDNTVLEIQIIENSQREDVHPLEEAEGYQRLIDKGIHTVETLSQKLGHSPRYVFDRIKLNSLTDEAKKAFADGRINIGGAQLLSRLGEADQAEFLNTYRNNIKIDKSSVSNFISRFVVLKVASFPFKASDAKLADGLPACTKCPKNTKNDQLLFPDEEGAKSGLCTDKACYQKKLAVYIDGLKESLRKETEYEGEIADISMCGYDAPEGTLCPSHWDMAKPDDEGAELGLIVYTQSWNADSLYKPLWYKRRKPGESGYSSPVKSAEEKAAEREKSRMDRVEMRTRKRVFDEIDAMLELWNPHRAGLVMDNLPRLLTAIAVKSVLMSVNSIGDTGDKDRHPGRSFAREVAGFPGSVWELKGISSKLSSVDIGTAIRAAFIASTYDEIHVDWRMSHNAANPDGFVLMAFAEVFGIDVEMIRKEADFELMSKKQQAEHLKSAGGEK